MDRLATQAELERVCQNLQREEEHTKFLPAVADVFWLASLGLADALYKMTNSKGTVKMQIYRSMLLLLPEDEALNLAELVSGRILKCIIGDSPKCKTCPLAKL